MATTPNFNMLIPDMDTVIDVDIPGLAASLGIIDTEMKHLEDNKLEASAAYVHPNHTGDVTSAGDGATTIANKAVTLAKMNDLTRGSILVGGEANAVTALDAKTSGKILVGDGTDLKSVAVNGDATLANTGALTIAAKAVTLAKMADMATASIIGRTTAAAGVPEVISKTDAKTLLDVDDLETDNTANKLNIAQNTKEISDLSKSLTAIAGGGSGSVTGSVTAPVSSLANTAAGAFSQLQLSGRTYTNIVKNGNFANGTTGWTGGTYASLTTLNNEMIATFSSLPTESHAFMLAVDNVPLGVVGNKYYVCMEIFPKYAGTTRIGLYGEAPYTTSTVANVWNKRSLIITAVTSNKSLGFYSDISTSGYVVGDTVKFREFIVIDLTATFGAGNEPDLATCDKLFANWFDGTKSTAPSEIIAVGANLEDKNYIQVVNGVNDIAWGSLIRVQPNTVIYLRQSVVGSYRPTLRCYDSSGVQITSGVTSSGIFLGYSVVLETWISGDNFTDGNTLITITANAEIYSVQFGMWVGSTPTPTATATSRLVSQSVQTYIPYQSVKSYTPILHSVPAIADTYDCVTGVHTVNTALDSDVSGVQYDSLDKTTYTNVDVIKTTAFTTAKAGTAAIDGMIRYYNSAGVELSEIAAASIDAVASVGKFYYHTDKTIWIFVAPDTYADIAAARTGLGTTSARYQLATPTVTYYPQKAIPCPANATISQDNIISDYGFYSSGLTISDSTYPIVTLAEVVKIDQSTGAETQIVLSTCTVAGGGLSFTSTALADGDLVWYRFYRSPFYTIGQIDYTRKYGVWEAWTPTLTWTTGTPASVTTVARAVKNGSTCTFNFMVTSADGNNASQLSISLPFAAKDNNSLISFSAQQLVNTTWTDPMAYLDDDSGGITFRSFAAATDGQTVTIIVSGQYEI